MKSSQAMGYSCKILLYVSSNGLKWNSHLIGRVGRCDKSSGVATDRRPGEGRCFHPGGQLAKAQNTCVPTNVERVALEGNREHGQSERFSGDHARDGGAI